MRLRTPRRLLSVLVVFIGLDAAYAQNQPVEEVIIQAQESDDAILEDAVSAAVLSGEKLQDAGIENVEDVAAYVPNLVLTETTTGTNIVIRGIGAGVNQGFDQSVGLYIDGVPLSRGQMARAPFLDLKGVEVLRGPQYVRDGNYSIAGSVHLKSQTASDEFELAIDSTIVPSQATRRLLVTMGTPLGESSGLRLAFQSNRSDGYVENVTLDEDGPSSDDLLFRGVFTTELFDGLNVQLKYEKGSFDTTGRQAEIIMDRPTEDYRDAADAAGLSPLAIDDIYRGALTVSGRGDQAPLPETITELDYRLLTIGSSYDAGYSAAPYFPELASGGSLNDVFYFAGKSYLETLEEIYLGTLTDARGEEIIGFRNINDNSIFTPLTAPGVQASVPRGLTDASLNFKRGADATEFSKNDSENITLNLEYFIDDHRFNFLASRVDYVFEENIDSDFTAAPLLVTEQGEDFTQDFYRFDYRSPEENRLSMHLGASYLESELDFEERIFPNVNLAENQAEVDEILQRNRSQERFYTFDGESPLTVYFGRSAGAVSGPAIIRSLELTLPDRQFYQDTEIAAGFLNVDFDITDTLRVSAGARYTYAEKAAVRDLAYLTKNGDALDLSVLSDADQRDRLSNLVHTYAILLNIYHHTDRGFPTAPQYQITSSEATPCVESLPDPIGSFAIGGPCDPELENQPFTQEAFLPTFSLSWDITPDITVYTKAAKANKLGGFDARSLTPTKIPRQTFAVPGTFRFEDENATTYELGAKWYLPDGWGQMFATAFYTDFENLQVSTRDRSVGTNVRNAGAAITKGVEIEGILTPTENFSINYSFAWIDFEFTDYEFGSCTIDERPDSFLVDIVRDNAIFSGASLLDIPNGTLVPIVYTNREFGVPGVTILRPGYGVWGNPQPLGVEFFNGGPNDGEPYNRIQRFDNLLIGTPYFCDFEGRTNQFVAEWQSTTSFAYSMPIQQIGLFKPSLDVIYNSGYHTAVNQDQDVYQDAYFQFNGRLALASAEDSWELALVGENLTNEKIVSYSTETPIATRVQASKGYVGFVRPPRSVGLNFRYKFY